jgi:hypothetical protein
MHNTARTCEECAIVQPERMGPVSFKDASVRELERRGLGEPPTRCEADRSAGPRHRRGGSPCVSCPRVPVDKDTAEGSILLLAGRLPPWIPACTGMTDTRGRVCTRAGRTNLGSDLLLGKDGDEFAAEVGEVWAHAALDQVQMCCGQHEPISGGLHF